MGSRAGGAGAGAARAGLGAAGGRNPGGWALAGPTGRGQGPRLGEGHWVGSWRWAEKVLLGVHCHPLGLSYLRFGSAGAARGTGEGGRAAGRDEGAVLAPPRGAGVSLSLGMWRPALPPHLGMSWCPGTRRVFPLTFSPPPLPVPQRLASSLPKLYPSALFAFRKLFTRHPFLKIQPGIQARVKL